MPVVDLATLTAPLSQEAPGGPDLDTEAVALHDPSAMLTSEAAAPVAQLHSKEDVTAALVAVGRYFCDDDQALATRMTANTHVMRTPRCARDSSSCLARRWQNLRSGRPVCHRIIFTTELKRMTLPLRRGMLRRAPWS